MKNCAYCNADGKLTKEHIWPGSILRKHSEKRLTYNARKEEFYIGDSVVKDVCEECNSESLSIIDSYLSNEYDKVFKSIVNPGEPVTFKYNYEMLLRSLLKITYNSVRAHKKANDKTVKALNEFAPYILHGGHRKKIMLRVQIVTASQKISITSGQENRIEPQVLRCADLQVSGLITQKFIVRLVAINSYWFYIIFPLRNQPPSQWRKFTTILDTTYHLTGVLISSTKSSLEIPVEKTTWFDPKMMGRFGEILKNPTIRP